MTVSDTVTVFLTNLQVQFRAMAWTNEPTLEKPFLFQFGVPELKSENLSDDSTFLKFRRRFQALIEYIMA